MNRIIVPSLVFILHGIDGYGKIPVLSPIEGISKEEQDSGIGYLDKMNENIENLRLGLKCN